MEKQSMLTFGELTKNLLYVKIIYNGKLIYDDTTDEGETIKHLHEIERSYDKKKVYEMTIKVINFHHCELIIEGEE
jgi:hypothetical protein